MIVYRDELVFNFKELECILSFFIYELSLKNSLVLVNLFNFIDTECYLKIGSFQYNYFLRRKYNLFSYAEFKSQFNLLLERYKLIKPHHSQFLGFKIRCSGRFSRRQRASSY